MKKVYKRTCPNCRETFETDNPNKKYCNDKCYMQFNKKQAKLKREERKKYYVRNCLWCGTEFEPHYPKKFCSFECREIFNSVKKRICNLYPFDSEGELDRLRELGQNYRFEDPKENLFYGLGEENGQN